MEIEDYIIANDQQLVNRVLHEGDDVAFEFLFTRYRESIRRLLNSKFGGGGSLDVDDLLQETFIKVYVNIHRYNPQYTFGQWIYTIARNTFIDHYRKRQDEQPLDDRLFTSESMLPNPEESVINSQKRLHIDNCICKLNSTQQRLFKMRFLDELSYEEIAEKLAMPLGTVKTNIFRARANMCRLIEEGDS
ncbi:MAG: sigma-70 family RNA polymerase sigma factor [Rikenellaceae bacterium]